MANQAKSHNSLLMLTEGAIMVAMAAVLSVLPFYKAPFGGSVTPLSMAPIILFSMRWGVKYGVGVGFVYSLTQLVLGLSDVAWVPDAGGIVLCILFDYLLPFTAIGLGGMLRNVKFSKNGVVNTMIAISIGALVVILLRYLCHVVSGVVVWYALDLEWYADDPTHLVNTVGPWMFSVMYNGSYMIPEILTHVVALPILAATPLNRYLRAFLNKEKAE